MAKLFLVPVVEPTSVPPANVSRATLASSFHKHKNSTAKNYLREFCRREVRKQHTYAIYCKSGWRERMRGRKQVWDEESLAKSWENMTPQVFR